jgi:hypothetical protein
MALTIDVEVRGRTRHDNIHAHFNHTAITKFPINEERGGNYWNALFLR